MTYHESYLKELKKAISKESKIIKELININVGLSQLTDQEEKSLINSQINSLKTALRNSTEEVSSILEDMSMTQPLPATKVHIASVTRKISPEDKIVVQEELKPEIVIRRSIRPPKIKIKKHKLVDVEVTDIERKIVKRLKKKTKKVEKKKEEKANMYVSMANKIFGGISRPLSESNMFSILKMDLIKANLKYVPSSYLSIMLLSSFLAIFIGLIVMLFFLFFNLGVELPIITKATEGLGVRFVKVFWIVIAAPLGTLISMYVYPSLERKHRENKINEELPFATIYMSAISGSMVEPSKMFNIMINTKEYPYLEKEFTKLINEINIYGHDFITSLRNVAFNSPSSKLGELFNGIATTINSGGDLPEFFDKRAQTLLFDYKIEREKYTKTAETFMDIYISLVIAAPMILMLLLIMMRVSGLGVAMSTGMITLVMILGVTMVNILFLTFLQLKQPQN